MYEHALSPLAIGGTVIKNRVVRAAHTTMLAAAGQFTDQLIAYHAARAEGGVGLTILEAAGVHRSSILSLANVDDTIIASYRALVRAVAPTGMKLFQQLWHGGHIYVQPDGTPPWAPSRIPSLIAGIAPRPMTHAQIDEIVASYAAAARRCEQGGLDGVEIHAGHGYLLAQFLSPVFNQREDEYGGDLDDRMRLLMRVMTAVRDAVSPGFVVGVRLSESADPRILAMRDVVAIAARLERDGLIDFVDMSYGDYYSLHSIIGGMDVPTGFQVPITAAAVADLKVPRLLNGRFRTLEEVEQVLRAGDADMVSMVRAHIADPDIVAKSAAGRPDLVRPCLACNQGCVGRAATLGRIGCVVNTAVGEEAVLAERLIDTAADPRTVLVVGGGPAGMEAARIAATAGHRVVLVEAAQDLGGLMNLYRRAPRMGTITDLSLWLEQEVYRLGVQVRLSTYMDADDIVAEGADVVILAIGGRLDTPGLQIQFPAESVPIAPQARVISAIDLFSEPNRPVGNSAVVVDEVGHYEAIAAAEYLLEKGVAVTFVTRHKMFAPGVDIALRTQSALERLYARGDFVLRVGSHLVAAREGVADIKPVFGHKLEQVAADTVVWVTARAGQTGLADDLQERGVTVLPVGDMISARNLQTAIREGHLAARSIASVATAAGLRHPAEIAA